MWIDARNVLGEPAAVGCPGGPLIYPVPQLYRHADVAEIKSPRCQVSHVVFPPSLVTNLQRLTALSG